MKTKSARGPSGRAAGPKPRRGVARPGVRTFPTETCVFLADFSPYDAAQCAERFKAKGILIDALKTLH
ncbi:MAG TPA: hypothetical protein VLY45_06050 [Nitrospiria bacterium]|nr:hypothetical protein [Nitrospiria bacterium]